MATERRPPSTAARVRRRPLRRPPSRPPRRIVVLADLGGPDGFHVGDEAMAEATIAWLRSLSPGGLDITVTSADPDASAQRLACTAVPWVGFADCDDEAARDALSARAARTPRAFALLDAVASADALVLAGGGNLNAMWPDHVRERVLAAAIAHQRGIPVVLSGQTLGPFDDGPERALVSQLVQSADVVGVREPHSVDEARSLGVDADRLVHAPDDAILLAPRAPQVLPPGVAPHATTHAAPQSATPSRRIAVTVHPFAAPGDPRYAALGHQLGTLAERVGAQILLVPHVRRAEHPDRQGDTEVAATLAAASGGTVLGAPGTAEAAWASHHAWMVLSTRYHPIVFATAAAVPALALTDGHYTAVKSRGALSQVGCEPWWVDVDAAASGHLIDAASELARRREEVADWMREHDDAVRSRDAWRRWRLAEALGFPVGSPPTTVAGPAPDSPAAPRPAGDWAATRA